MKFKQENRLTKYIIQTRRFVKKIKHKIRLAIWFFKRFWLKGRTAVLTLVRIKGVSPVPCKDCCCYYCLLRGNQPGQGTVYAAVSGNSAAHPTACALRLQGQTHWGLCSKLRVAWKHHSWSSPAHTLHNCRSTDAWSAILKHATLQRGRHNRRRYG